MNIPALDDGFGGYLVLLVVGVLAHEPWRWMGLAIGARIEPDGDLFRWVRAVSNALVAALVARLIFFPVGVLATTHLGVRLAGLAAGFALFYVLRGNLAAAVLGGCAVVAIAILLGA